MEITEDIKASELEIRKVREKLLTIQKLSEKEKLSKKLTQLEFDQETAIMNFLESNDKSYNSIIQENFDLLINDHIEFNVTREESSFCRSHAKRFYGKVNENGYFYCRATETDFVFLNFQRGFYPLSYKGLVNYFGEADVYIDKKGYKLFGSRVPKKYIGSIDQSGNVYFETKESYCESFGDIYVNNIIADFFSGNNDKRKKFLDNKAQLKKIIDNYKRTIIST